MVVVRSGVTDRNTQIAISDTLQSPSPSTQWSVSSTKVVGIILKTVYRMSHTAMC